MIRISLLSAWEQEHYKRNKLFVQLLDTQAVNVYHLHIPTLNQKVEELEFTDKMNHCSDQLQSFLCSVWPLKEV